jgi:hypothetical protein
MLPLEDGREEGVGINVSKHEDESRIMNQE